MTGRDRFLAAVPELLEQAKVRNLRIGIAIRQALMDLHHYECPIGLHVDGTWVFVIAEKLESPNKFRAHWSLQNGSRAKWEKHMRDVVADALGVSSWGGVLELGRKPAVTVKMTLQIVRLVPSSREFIRDDDNLAFSRKGATDAMKRTGLLKEDRREWLEALPIHKPGRSAATLQRIAASRERYGRRFLIPFYSATRVGRPVTRPIGTITTKDRYALVDGDRMRMLSVAEYQRAMGFRADYVLTGNRAEQVKQLGNAVCPPVAAVILEQVA